MNDYIKEIESMLEIAEDYLQNKSNTLQYSPDFIIKHMTSLMRTSLVRERYFEYIGIADDDL